MASTQRGSLNALLRVFGSGGKDKRGVLATIFA